eukprot:6940495-Lingulodinium_polyedra.AAC.1
MPAQGAADAPAWPPQGPPTLLRDDLQRPPTIALRRLGQTRLRLPGQLGRGGAAVQAHERGADVEDVAE